MAQWLPADPMFQLTAEEFAALRSQFATSNKDGTQTATGRGGRRYAPRVFTEHGSLMVTTILNSPRAVEVSIYVVRAFVQLAFAGSSSQHGLIGAGQFSVGCNKRAQGRLSGASNTTI